MKQTIQDIETMSEDEIKRYLERNARVQTLKQKITDLIDHGNRYDEDELLEAMTEAMDRNHRTLQQGFMRVLRNFILWYGEKKQQGPGWFDARNEAAVNWAALVKETDTRAGGYGFPLI